MTYCNHENICNHSPDPVILIIAESIYENQYHCMPFAIMSGLLAWAMWPEKKQDSGKSYRDSKTWEN